jgi:hypothetical protein
MKSSKREPLLFFMTEARDIDEEVIRRRAGRDPRSGERAEAIRKFP